MQKCKIITTSSNLTQNQLYPIRSGNVCETEFIRVFVVYIVSLWVHQDQENTHWWSYLKPFGKWKMAYFWILRIFCDRILSDFLPTLFLLSISRRRINFKILDKKRFTKVFRGFEARAISCIFWFPNQTFLWFNFARYM